MGAPRASWPANESVLNPGAVFRCRIEGNSSGGCEQLQLGESGRGDPGTGGPGTAGPARPRLRSAPCGVRRALRSHCTGLCLSLHGQTSAAARGLPPRHQERKRAPKLDLGKLGVTDVVPTAVSHLSASGLKAPLEFRSDVALWRAGAAFRAGGGCSRLRDGRMEVCA